MTPITANLLIRFSIGSSLTEIWPNEEVMLPTIMEHLVRSRDTSRWKSGSFQTFKWLTSPLLVGYDAGMSGSRDVLVLTMSLPLHWVERGLSLDAQAMMRRSEKLLLSALNPMWETFSMPHFGAYGDFSLKSSSSRRSMMRLYFSFLRSESKN